MQGTDHIIRATLRALLAYRGISIPDFAEQIGISRTALYNRMAGDTPWSAEEVARIAVALDIPVATFYGGLQVAS